MDRLILHAARLAPHAAAWTCSSVPRTPHAWDPSRTLRFLSTGRVGPTSGWSSSGGGLGGPTSSSACSLASAIAVECEIGLEQCHTFSHACSSGAAPGLQQKRASGARAWRRSDEREPGGCAAFRFALYACSATRHNHYAVLQPRYRKARKENRTRQRWGRRAWIHLLEVSTNYGDPKLPHACMHAGTNVAWCPGDSCNGSGMYTHP